MSIIKDDIDINISSDIQSKSGSFSFVKSNLTTTGSADIVNKSFGLGYNLDDISSTVQYTPAWKDIFWKSGDFSVSAEKNNSLYKTVFSKDGHTVIGRVNNNVKAIEYQGMNSIIILSNNKEYLDYNGQDSVRIQDKKVYVNGQEVYDFSNAPNLINIDFNKINFPNLDLSSVNFTELIYHLLIYLE